MQPTLWLHNCEVEMKRVVFGRVPRGHKFRMTEDGRAFIRTPLTWVTRDGKRVPYNAIEDETGDDYYFSNYSEVVYVEVERGFFY